MTSLKNKSCPYKTYIDIWLSDYEYFFNHHNWEISKENEYNLISSVEIKFDIPFIKAKKIVKQNLKDLCVTVN